MGLYDRDYYRKDEPAGILSGRSMVWNLIIANGIVFVLQVMFSDGDVDRGPVADWLSLPASFFDRPWEVWRLVTYGFVHGGFFHLLFNMVGLWSFGPDVEDSRGRDEFVRFYLLALVFCGVVWLVLQRVGDSNASGLIGASGAVTGIILLSVLPDPKRDLYVFGARVPAWFFAALFILSDMIGAYRRVGPVAHSAHLAGAAFAAGYFYLGLNFETILPTRLFKRLTGPRLRVHKPDDDDPRDLSTRVDEILDKIHREGEASLTANERRTLEEASRRYQRRQKS